MRVFLYALSGFNTNLCRYNRVLEIAPFSEFPLSSKSLRFLFNMWCLLSKEIKIKGLTIMALHHFRSQNSPQFHLIEAVDNM